MDNKSSIATNDGDGGAKAAHKLPIYERIKESMRHKIESGELPPGSRVASEHALASELSVSRGQVRQALRDLEMEGLLERFRGRGSFVASRTRKPRPFRPGKTKSLILAYPGMARDNYSYHVRRLVEGFVHEAIAHEFSPTFFYLDADPEAEIRFLNNLKESGVDGVALWAQFRTAEECSLVESIALSQFPCVLVDRYLPGVETNFVGTANRMAFAHLTNHLMRRGHRNIGYVTRRLNDSVIEDRFAGYRNALVRAGIDYRDELMVQGKLYGVDFDHVSNYFTRTRASATPPTAFVCSDNWVSDVLLDVVEATGICPAAELDVATMDDTFVTGESDSGSRSIAVQDGFEIGRQAAELLIGRIGEPSKVYEQRFIRPQFLLSGGGDRYSESEPVVHEERR